MSERLEVRERQAAAAEDAITAREAQVQLEVEERVAKARADLAEGHRLDLELLKAELEGRTSALKTELQSVEQRESAAREALTSSESALASARAELSSLQQQIKDTASLAKKTASEANRRQTLQREHASMLQGLRLRANSALGTICDESAPHPHENDYASHLSFFTDIVTRLEARAARSRELVAERSRGLLGRVFSRVFSHLLNHDPHFDFDDVLVPMPPVVQDNLAGWVDDHMDALVAEFAPEDDTVMIAAREVGADGHDEEYDSLDASSVNRGDEEGASS